MGLCDFSSTKVTNFIRECKAKEYTLWLKHTKRYNLINAYNLAVMSVLAYSDVRTDKEKGDRDVSDFLKKFASKMKLSHVLKESGEVTSVDQLVKEVDKGEGIDTKGHMIDKATSTEAFWFADSENIVLAVRGTQEIDKDMILHSLLSGDPHAPDDAVIDMDAKQVEMDGIMGRVHRGFKRQAKAIIDDASFLLFLNAAKGKKLFVTGHSLGAAVATILAAYLKGRGFDPLLYTYGSPRAGNETFVKAYADITHYRHVYHNDVIPLVPGRNLDVGIPELNLCVKKGVTTGFVVGGVPGSLSGLVGSLYLCTRKGSGPGYYHHGTLCRIVSAGSGSIMAPFEWHGIVADRISALLKKKQEAAAHLARVKNERVDTDNSGISTPWEWYKHYARVDEAEDRLEDAKDALRHLPEDRKGDYTLVAALDGGVTDHFMGVSYLPFLKKEIQIQWKLYKDKHCKESRISQTPSSDAYGRIQAAIDRVRLEIRGHNEAIKNIYASGVIDDQISAGRLDMASQTRSQIRLHEKLRNALEHDLIRLEKMKQVKIGTYSLYTLRAGDPELNKQLEKFR